MKNLDKERGILIGADGFTPPSGRIYSNMFSLPLGGNTSLSNTTGYSGQTLVTKLENIITNKD